MNALTKREIARRQIEQLLRESSYAAGDRIPSVDALAELLGLGRMGVQQAVRDLVDSGVLKTVLGKGTYLLQSPDHSSGSPAAPAAQLPDFPDILVSSHKRLRIGLCGELPWHETVWRRVALAFMERHPDITIELESVKPSNGAWDNPPDIVQVPSFQIRTVVERGCLFDPTEIEGIGVSPEAFYPGALSGATIDGVLWGTPTFCAPACLFCNVGASSRYAPLLDAGGWWDAMETAAAVGATAAHDQALLLSRSPTQMMMAAGVIGTSYHPMELFEKPDCQAFWHRLERYFTDPAIFGRTERGVHPTPALWDAFLGERGSILIGTTSWLEPLSRSATFPLALRPVWAEPPGSTSATVIYSCIHRTTPFPIECCQFLRHLSSRSVLEEFARRGQPVAHRKANEAWRIQGVDADSMPSLRQAMESCATIHSDPHAPEFYATVINHELTRWQHREIDTDTFLAEMQQRGRFFYRSRTTQSPARPWPPASSVAANH